VEISERLWIRRSFDSQDSRNWCKTRDRHLPFLNQSDDSAREYFADGLTQTSLMRWAGFRADRYVMERRAPIQGQTREPRRNRPQPCSSLSGRSSVRQSGDRVRVNAQLVDVDGRVLWSGNFDEALADVFCLARQDYYSDRWGLSDPRDAQRATAGLRQAHRKSRAYDYVLRARPALQRPTRANNAEARVLLRHATELDPNYAAAYAAFAETYHIAMAMGWAESQPPFSNAPRNWRARR